MRCNERLEKQLFFDLLVALIVRVLHVDIHERPFLITRGAMHYRAIQNALFKSAHRREIKQSFRANSW